MRRPMDHDTTKRDTRPDQAAIRSQARDFAERLSRTPEDARVHVGNPYPVSGGKRPWRVDVVLGDDFHTYRFKRRELAAGFVAGAPILLARVERRP